VNDEVFATKVRMLMALAFLPVQDVPAGFEIIKSSMPDVGMELVQYFDSTYVNGPPQRGTTGAPGYRAPMFRPAIWNMSQRSVQPIRFTLLLMLKR